MDMKEIVRWNADPQYVHEMIIWPRFGCASWASRHWRSGILFSQFSCLMYDFMHCSICGCFCCHCLNVIWFFISWLCRLYLCFLSENDITELSSLNEKFRHAPLSRQQSHFANVQPNKLTKKMAKKSENPHKIWIFEHFKCWTDIDCAVTKRNIWFYADFSFLSKCNRHKSITPLFLFWSAGFCYARSKNSNNTIENH